MDTETKTQPLAPEVLAKEPTEIVTRDGGALAGPTMASMASAEDGIRQLERMGALQDMLQVTLIRLTEPEDWVRSKNGELVTAMPTKAANLKMARFLGLEIQGLDGGGLAPEIVFRGESKIRGFRVAFRVRCQKIGVEWRVLETTRWEDEDFTGRTVDAADKIAFRGERALESDLRSAAYSAAMNKGTKEITGLGKVPDALLLRAWNEDQKKLDRCQKGHGFGSAKERKTEQLAEAGSKEDANALWAELLKINDGDVAEAGEMLGRITVQADGKYAKKSVKAFTAGWQVKKAWDRLEQLPEYKAYREGAPTREREPGEEG